MKPSRLVPTNTEVFTTRSSCCRLAGAPKRRQIQPREAAFATSGIHRIRHTPSLCWSGTARHALKHSAANRVPPPHPEASRHWRGHRSERVLRGCGDSSRRSGRRHGDRKSTRLNSSHGYISYAVFCLKKKKKKQTQAYTIIKSCDHSTD